MVEAEPIEERITQALREIERKEAERRRRKAGLQGTLSRLEDRFNARHSELEDLKERYHALGDANREVESHILRLSDLVEHAATEAAEASAALTLQLRTEMLSVADRFEDVSQEELDAEDAAGADDRGTTEVAHLARRASN
jgi:hypothetical protein